jgi:hypothetical protein
LIVLFRSLEGDDVEGCHLRSFQEVLVHG